MAFRLALAPSHVKTMTQQERTKLYELMHRYTLFLDGHSSIPTKLFFQQERNMQNFAGNMARAALPPVQAVNHDRGDITVVQRLTEEQVDRIDEAFVRAVLEEAQILNGETAVSFPMRQSPLLPPILPPMEKISQRQEVLDKALGMLFGVGIGPAPANCDRVTLVEDDEEVPAAAPAEPEERTLGSAIASILYTPIGWIVGLFALLRKCLGL